MAKPTIKELSNAPIGSTIQLWRNKETTKPEVWVKRDSLSWHSAGALPRHSSGMNLTTYYRATLKENTNV